MKKFVSILMVLCMLTAVATMAVSATDAVTSAPVAEYTDAPDWIITEINPDDAIYIRPIPGLIEGGED